MNKHRPVIGLFCDALPPVVDGVVNVLMNYAGIIQDTFGDVFVSGPGVFGKRAGSFPFSVITYPSFTTAKMKPYRIPLPGVVSALRWKCRKIPFDLIHAHSPFGFGHAARNIARRRKIPCVGTFHSKYYQDFKRHTGSDTIAGAVAKSIGKFYQTLDVVFTMNP